MCLLKLIIRYIHLDINATINMIQSKLSNLYIYIYTTGNDINKINVYFLQLIYTLTSQGETMQDILTDMFKVYRAFK